MAWYDNKGPILQIDRLQKAIDTLTKVHEQKKKFYICAWFEDRDDPHKCGTAACSLGWIARSKWAQEQGLTTMHDIPYFEEENGYDAGAKFFGISYDLSSWLFDPGSYVSKSFSDVKAIDTAVRIQYILDHPNFWPHERNDFLLFAPEESETTET